MIVDRIEGDVAVVELSKGSFKDIPLSRIDGRVRDGVALVDRGEGAYEVDEGETAERAKRIKAKMDSLFK